MKKINDFGSVKIENSSNVKGGVKFTKSIGGDHKGQYDYIDDDGVHTWL